ncbi:hypothetical protein RhiirA5_487421 [Rhizophagus irregularis]|uniref:Uncharacterized protein n=1 Tax=Rhizophagus irregularis TaxID=588596 RepID=A0A2I1E3U8_9GLOM|nr:hypothetical protein RhiirA5_487421 [Rhizophagus irregularis]PKC72763.1 hypothetical protein RhiirA1_389496 [Rhizophagus irregularis]PKY16822.1 hypothetical protein RhiirB3_483988 [Rhizophagus irregularis]
MAFGKKIYFYCASFLCFASFLMGALFGLLVQIIIYFYKRKTAEEGQFPDVNEETKMLIKEWGKVITNKYKDIEKDYNLNEEMFCNEPLLVIDYDQFGLERRKITDSHVAKRYTLIPRTGNESPDLKSIHSDQSDLKETDQPKLVNKEANDY